MKIILLVVFIAGALSAGAQVKKVSIEAGGMTCSMCSKAISKALQSVDFVENVDPDFKTSSFEVTFKPGADVDFDQLKKKVEDAGFYVVGFRATIHFDNLKIKDDASVQATGKNLMFIHVTEQELNGDKIVKLLDKGFVTSREYKKNSAFTSKECYKTGMTDAAPTQGGASKSRIYHVTI
jgi:copper chaperone CopZ